jgi:hypothetical protein
LCTLKGLNGCNRKEEEMEIHHFGFGGVKIGIILRRDERENETAATSITTRLG